MGKQINHSIVFSLFLIIYFLGLNVYSQTGKKYEEKNILVLHSYHQGLEWTDNISNGIQSVFEDKSDVNLFFEYLDTKRNFSKEYFEALTEIYNTKAAQNPYSAIITCDNAAFDFMQKYSDIYYPGVPIIYCGVNNLDTTILKSIPNFYGFGEKIDYYETIESIQKIFPNKKNILIINDNTFTGKAIAKELIKVFPRFDEKLNFEILSEFDFQDIFDKVRSLDDTYAIYLLVINRDKNGKFISYRQGISAIQEVSTVPIFGSWDFYENKGLFGGKITRGYDQGRNAAVLAEAIIKFGVSEHMSQFNYVENNYVFDYLQMNKFEVAEDQLPEGSLIINTPSDHHKYLNLLKSIAVILIISIIFLYIRLLYRKKTAIKLERLVDEKTISLQEINTVMEEINIKKDRFLSIMSHDIKNPFNSLMGFSELLKNESDNLSYEEQRKLIDMIDNGLNQTYKLLEDLLSWSHAQTGSSNFNPQKENISILIKEIIEVLAFSAGQKSINIIQSVPKSLSITADLDMLSTIIRNLISNAIKYTPRNGYIEINVEEIINDNEVRYIEFSIKDNGVGMPKATLDKLFDISGVSSRKGTENEPGSGLGLILCYEFTKMHNGEIWAISEENKGSTFVFTIPTE